jgi:hypothetical protein
METFNKFKDWILNLVGVALVGGIISIKNDLAEIKAEYSLIRYRLDKLETNVEAHTQKEKEQDEKLVILKEMILPKETKIKRKYED